MRKFLIVAAVLGAVGLGLFMLSRWGGSPEVSSPGQPSASLKPAATKLGAESPEDLGARGTADAGSTPTLARLPSEGDGLLEVEVLAGGRPVPGASARLYWRGARDPNLGEVSWRLASTGTTDAQGRVRLASRPGLYLVAVRAPGYAPLKRDVTRPSGEVRTFLSLTLEQGQSLTGHTVVKGSREPLPLVELVFTVQSPQLPLWQDAEAPAEERAYASSDARGAFSVEGLASGSYLLEARAPGHARAVMRNVRVPAAGPLTVALSVAGVIEGFVVDAQGQPAAGAEVLLGGFVPQTVSTGEGGGFSVEVEAGDYTVSARRGEEAGALDSPVPVSAGQTVRDVRVRLGQGAGVEGRVVAHATGAPVAEAKVDVSPYGASGDSGRAVTDSQGHFSVGALAPGSYDVVVNAPGFAPLTRRGLTVSGGERFTLELALTATGAVEGQVRTGAGQPVAGALVTAGTRWGGPLVGEPAESRTNAEGHYRLEGLGVGRLYLSARWEGATAGVSQPVEVTEGGTQRLDFTLEETGTVEGVVRAAQGALPSSPLTVMAFPQDGDRSGPAGIGQTQVEARGNFTMSLPPGTYDLYVSEERRGLGLRKPKQVRVEAGRTVQAELTWQSEAPGTDELRGIVLEPSGAPSPLAFVTLSIEGQRGGVGSLIPTDEEGRFSMPLPAGRGGTAARSITLSARNGGRMAELHDVKPEAGEVVVRLQPAASIQGRVVRAGQGLPVRGFTVSFQPRSWDRFPLDDLSWEFAGDRFELRDVPAEPLELVVRTADGARGDAQVFPDPGASVTVEVTLAATAGVRGRVVDAATLEPISEAFIFLEGERPMSMNQETASDGRFKLDGVAPGEHTLVVVAGREREPVRRPITVVEGQVHDVGDVALSVPRVPSGTIGIRVSPEGARIVISQVVHESPAARAGLEVGDVLLSVDGTPVTELMDAFRRLKGAPSSPVVLTVRREGTEQSFSVLRAP
ncbi:carboxypeptidase regulatory-like domain-containing protein [Hyalangium rubrum]|uniref:Carboxypeptidase regulatory-like domain-containing protein n=1 Tax=Hyalangium rubrum TaxID=3103134 RepID=A0ABU5H7I6_9BACT|nr:carboxypeptidase regulatory-like domain-containing protein [Hyalangium sp. s54d21]MDY7229305.1 carboxypeptidase regulatory-like domain-containing protein [Hyalangium sp. s54d21]